MVWFKVDDKLHDHPKVRRLGKDKLAALGLWTTCGSWAADTTSDGFVPREVVRRHDPRERVAAKLVSSGLWAKSEQNGEIGYQFHQWDEYQPTAASIEADREEWRKKKASQRKGKRGVSPGDNKGTSKGSPNGSPPRFPVPVPVPVPSMGHLGEEESGRDRAEFQDPPPPKCPEHINHDGDPGPCRACGDARRARQRWDAEQERVRAELAAALDVARQDPRLRCGHGTDGGLYVRPDTGTSPCALCRAETAKAPA